MSSTTLQTLLEQFVEEWHLGRVGTCTSNGTTTTLIDLTRFGGPFSGSAWMNGGPIRMTGAGNRAGQTSNVSNYAPVTGTLTLNPAMTNASQTSDTFIALFSYVADHVDRLIEALNRGLNRHARRRMRVPLTFVPNGDYLAAAATTGWTATDAAAASYVDLAHPDGYYQRVLQNTASAANGRLTSTTLKATAGDTWDIATFMRVTTAGDIAALVVYDETNAAAITVTYSTGAATTSSLDFVDVRGQFTIPAGSTQISIRLQSSANGDVSQWGPVLAAPQQNQTYTGQTWWEFPHDAGDFFTCIYGASTASPAERSYYPVTIGYDLDQYGWGQGFKFDRQPPNCL